MVTLQEGDKVTFCAAGVKLHAFIVDPGYAPPTFSLGPRPLPGKLAAFYPPGYDPISGLEHPTS